MNTVAIQERHERERWAREHRTWAVRAIAVAVGVTPRSVYRYLARERPMRIPFPIPSPFPRYPIGPAPCQGCGSLVTWDAAARRWCDGDGLGHRCR